MVKKKHVGKGVLLRKDTQLKNVTNLPCLVHDIFVLPSVAPIVLITDPLPLNMRPTGTFVNPPIPSSNWAGGKEIQKTNAYKYNKINA